ncbi:MAG: hypothetical protein NC898_01880 [Candidatus Omnitrophica bacterium]|nr:hypothetical protein [Candidatus Omnitrophota bacterium]MCM8793202.1 hypothetical protein [Candidatus Omnitrophota bacterium]
MKKWHFSTDGFNRLVIKEKKKQYPVEGEFKIVENELSFFPSMQSRFTRELDLPKRMEFTGKWRLNKNHNLSLVLTETDYQYRGDILEIKGKIFAVEPEALIFQAHFKQTAEGERISLLRLGGRWQSDKFNRINFLVTRETEEDVLKFSSAWEVTKNHQIVYIYEKRDYFSGRKTWEFLEFKGYWEIPGKHRLRYVLDFKNGSLFQFRGFWEIPEKQGKRGEIRCRIGVGIKKSFRENIFSLSGEWKVKEKNKLFLNVDYGEEGFREIVFKIETKLDKHKNLVFLIRNRDNEPLGAEIRFARDFLKENKRFFLHLFGSGREKILTGGIDIFW